MILHNIELKKQIEATIKAYEKACRFYNLHIWYCMAKGLQWGICHYANEKNYHKLKHKVMDFNNYSYNLQYGYYITDVPIYLKLWIIDWKKPYKILQAHRKRIKFLKAILKEIK